MSEVLAPLVGTTQALVFFSIFAISGLGVVALAILGEILEGVGDGVEHLLEIFHIDDIFDTDTPGSSAGVFSLRVLAAFATGLGGGGWYMSIQGYGPVSSTFGGCLLGGGIGLVVFLGLQYLTKQQSSSTVEMHILIGKMGSVQTGIPKGGYGEVQVVVAGIASIFRARTEDGNAIRTGTIVRIKSISGSDATVETVNT